MKKLFKLLLLSSFVAPCMGFGHDVMAQQSAKPEQLIKWWASHPQVCGKNAAV
jgi:hypothetical protein